MAPAGRSRRRMLQAVREVAPWNRRCCESVAHFSKNNFHALWPKPRWSNCCSKGFPTLCLGVLARHANTQADLQYQIWFWGSQEPGSHSQNCKNKKTDDPLCRLCWPFGAGAGALKQVLLRERGPFQPESFPCTGVDTSLEQLLLKELANDLRGGACKQRACPRFDLGVLACLESAGMDSQSHLACRRLERLPEAAWNNSCLV